MAFDRAILGRLSDATVDELNAALGALAEDYQSTASQPASQDHVNALTSIRDAAQALRAELNNRQAMAAEHAALRDDLSQLFTTDEPDDNAATTGTVPNQPGADVQRQANEQHDNRPQPTPEDNQPGSTTNEGADTDGDQEGQDSVTASGRRPLGTGGVKPRAGSGRVALGQVQLRTTAAAAVPGVSPGQQLDRTAMVQAFVNKAESVRNVPGYERYPVVTVRSQFPTERHLARGADSFTNMAKVEAAVDAARSVHARVNMTERVALRQGPQGLNALTAAGRCAPLETLYDIRTIGDTDRPVRDTALVRFGADRGGIQYRPAISGVTQTGGIGFWTMADDEADPIVPKTCVEIDCPGVVTAEVEAIYQCLTFSNVSSRFDPESMDAAIRAQDIAHARIAENRLLTTMTTASKDVYSTKVLGAVRDILVTLDKMVAYQRSVHRLADETPLRWVAPLWAKYLMRADMVRQMVGDGLQALAVTDAMLNQWLGERNLNVTWHLDGIDPADLTTPEPDIPVPAQLYTLLVDQSAVPGFPDAISTLLYPEGDWLALDGGELNLGVVRDSTLNADNRFQTFSEGWEFPAFRGVESIHLVLRVQPTGQSAATADTSGLTD